MRGYNQNEIGKIKFSVFTVTEPGYDAEYRDAVDILIDCIEKAVANDVVDMTGDKKDHNDKKDNNEKEKPESQGPN